MTSIVDAARFAGIADALDLAREEAARLRDGRRTQTVTWRQLDDALDGARNRCADRRSWFASDLAEQLAELAARPRSWSTSPARSRANAATTLARTCCSGWRRAVSSIEGHRRDLGRRPRRPPRWRQRLAILEDDRAVDGACDGVRLPARPRAQAAVDRLSGDRRRARPELLRSPRVRGAARELHRDRQGRRPGPPLVPSRPRRHAGRAWRRADLLVGIDVRISDAVAGHARAGGKPARADEPADRAAADRLRGRRSACPGAFRNPPTTPAIWSSPTNIRTSASPASG